MDLFEYLGTLLILFAAGWLIGRWRRHKAQTGCKHWNTRCLHGDEINARANIMVVPWKPIQFYRQVCTDCGAPLDRPAICTINPGEHTWKGPWLFFDTEGL